MHMFFFAPIRFYLFFGFFILLSHTALAEVLPAGVIGVHQSFGVSSYSSLWMGDQSMPIGMKKDQKQKGNRAKTTQASNAKADSGATVTSFISDTSAAFGLGRGFQLDAHLQFRQSSLSGGDEGGRTDGESNSGVGEVGMRLRKQLFMNRAPDSVSTSSNVFAGFRTPGDAPNTGNDFLALSDGITKYDLGLSGSIGFGPISLEPEFVFTVRPYQGIGNQVSFQLAAPFNFIPGVSFGPLFRYFNTLSGPDIGDPEFEALGKKLGGMPFSYVKEEYLSLGAFIAVPITRNFYIDASFQKKVNGRNTDQGFGVTGGLGLSF